MKRPNAQTKTRPTAQVKSEAKQPLAQQILFALLLALLAFVAYRFMGKLAHQSPALIPLSEVRLHQERVNAYLQELQAQEELRHIRVQRELLANRSPLKGHLLRKLNPIESRLSPGVDMQIDPFSEERHALERTPSRWPAMPKDIDHAVNVELHAQQMEREYNKIFLEEFKRHLVENAARDGYGIEFEGSMARIIRRNNSTSTTTQDSGGSTAE